MSYTSWKTIKPKTLGQKLYTSAIKQNDIVFGIGQRVQAKTYLCFSYGSSSFQEKEVSRIY
ncbi:MAG: PhoH family protein [Tepidanaerobacteraceae bacterium]